MEIELKNESDFEKEVLKEEGLVIVDFYADWCQPCSMLSGQLQKVDEKNPNIKIVRINVDNSEKLAIEHGVTAIPALFYYKNGKIANKTVGYISSSDIESLLGKIE